VGGWFYESDENNPMLGFRGASRYVSDDFQNAFILELKAIKKAREWGLINIIPMIPFLRTPEEATQIERIMVKEGLIRGQNGLKVYCMAEIPSNIFLADIFCKTFDGFSIGSNDLTQLIYGAGRDNEKLISLSKNYNYVTNSEAIRRAVSHLIKVAHENSRTVGICGQAPSDDPEFLRFLVREEIDSISLNFDTFARGRINTWRTEIIEKKLTDKNKELAYLFLSECDNLIEKVRIPRGKLRNLARKKRKEIFQSLNLNISKFDEIFENTTKISNEFVNKVNSGQLDNYDKLYKEYYEQLQSCNKLIPQLMKNIREFGIF
jgi:phosphoenolpyruvate-protein kinase (PTS system EI component)